MLDVPALRLPLLDAPVELAEPVRLLALLAVAALAVWAVLRRVGRSRRAAALASPALLPSLVPVRRGWTRALATSLLLLGLAVASVAWSRPQVLAEQARERSVVVVVLDTSTSMLADDVLPDRFTAAVAAAQAFVRDLPDAVDVGLVAYDARVRLVVAPTADEEAVVRALDGLDLSGGTALGDAVLTALAAVPEELLVPVEGAPPPARLVVLSDGGSTTGRPLGAAVAAAREVGVPVSTIAYGTDAGVVVQDGRTFPVPVEEGVLQELAGGTGGTSYDASDAGQLQAVYDDIGAQVTREVERVELSSPVAGLALVLLLSAGAVGMLAGGRLA